MTNKKLDIPIYLVSLEQDVTRREKLKKQFPETYSNFQHIKAVDGRILSAKEYFDKTQGFYKKYKRIMLPAELGCSLSHIKALTDFLNTDNAHALIIEDDIIGTDKDFSFISEFIKSTSFNGITFCGCQDGLLLRYKYGRPITHNILKIAHSNRDEFSRTAAYIVSRSAAETILEFHNNEFITIADFWFDLLKNLKGDIYYLSVFSHPLDLTDSNIERDRVVVSKNLMQKIFSKNVIILIYKRLKKEVKRFWYKMNKHEEIKIINND